jgi:D-aminopeptidase
MSRKKSFYLKWKLLILSWICIGLVWGAPQIEKRGRARDFGVETGILPAGKWNTITDVPGVMVGHKTLIVGDSVRTGVTAVLPHDGNVFQEKVPAAVFVGNGFGKLAGSTQIQELGEIETPIILTNTLSVSTALGAVVKYTLRQEGNETVRSVNGVVGETNDGWLNDIRGFHVREPDVWEAIQNADSGAVSEGCVGAGTGTSCLGFKGGIGTASRKLPSNLGGWTVGVLVQTNFSGILSINGAPVGRELGKVLYRRQLSMTEPGSCMIVVATDAPLLSRNLKRLASRALLGLARCGSFISNGSGDYVIAFSAHPDCRMDYSSRDRIDSLDVVRNDKMSPLLLAVVEATEEAVLNSIFMATTVEGMGGHRTEALPVKRTIDICRKYNVLNWSKTLPLEKIIKY